MPTDEQIKVLHKKYAKTAADFTRVYVHCQIIDAIAMQLLDAHPAVAVNRELVHVGCMLHDIGVYDLIQNGEIIQGVRHGVIGENILKREGFSESIWRIASHHTGVGLTADDVKAQGLPIPPADYTAATPEERLIMYADKFHTKGTTPYFCTLKWRRNELRQFGPDKAAALDALAAQFGTPNLAPLQAQFGHEIKSAS